ncbi:MAG: helix-turn-helix domain-containing protein [Firmicutes bacterium]|nr:helix-turn-helix domain-containing protein [Bacillota bacterium]
MATLGERLKQLRKEKGLTQAELAKAVGLSKSAIIQYENNKRNPNFNALIALGDFFNVSGSYLTGKSDYRRSSEEMFFNEVLKMDEKIADKPDDIKRKVISLMNHFYEVINSILKAEIDKKASNGNNIVDERNIMLSNLYTTLDILKRVYFGNYLPSKEEWENGLLSELDYYKRREAIFQRYTRDLTEKWKIIFTLRCKHLYEQYVSEFDRVRNDKIHLEVLEEIKNEFETQDDPYPRFVDKRLKDE